MRNWASAAHPNQNQITGLQLIAWFETCVKEVIALPETSATAQIKALLSNMKTHALNDAGAQHVSGFFVDLTSDQSNNLMAGFFGIYTNDTSLPLGGVLINETARVPVDGPVHHRSPPRRVQVVPATAIIQK